MSTIAPALITASAVAFSSLITVGGIYFSQHLQDRRRFIEHKKDAYSDLLSLFRRWTSDLSYIGVYSLIEPNARSALKRWAMPEDVQEQPHEDYLHVGRVLAQVELLSTEVRKCAVSLYGHLNSATYAELHPREKIKVPDIEDLHEMLTALAKVMRVELGTEKR